MDNILFESQITFTRDILKESIRVWFFKSKIWLLFLIPIIMIIIGTIYAVFYENYTMLIAGVFFGILFTVVVLMRYHFDTERSYKLLCEQNNGQEITYSVKFFDDKIILLNLLTKTERSYIYSVINQVIENKNLILLITEAKAFIGLEKLKFIIGTSNELVDFIKSKILEKQIALNNKNKIN